MKQYRFFVRQPLHDVNEISLADQGVIHQMKNVLRLKKGDQVILCDGSGIEFHGKVKILTQKESIISKEKIKKISRKNKINIHLFVSVIKKDKFEWVLQKVTELGVSRVTPIISERTEKQKINMDRADKIVREACEQSGRTDFMFVDEPIKLKEALRICETEPMILDLHGELFNVSHIRETAQSDADHPDVSLFIGPEGGWDDRDWEQFDRVKHKRVTLGEQVLRAETASIAVSALLLLG